MIYFAVGRFRLDPETSAACDAATLKSAAQSLREKFRVTSAVSETLERDGEASLAVAAFGKDEAALGQLLDSIAAHLEGSGLGRVASEASLVAPIDSLDDEPEDDAQTS